MDQNLTGFIVCICFVLGIFVLQYVFYGEEITYIIDNTSFTGGILDIVSYLWVVISIFTSMLLVSLPGFPLVLQVVILIPFWGAIIYIMIPILKGIADLIINGLDAIIPF